MSEEELKPNNSKEKRDVWKRRIFMGVAGAAFLAVFFGPFLKKTMREVNTDHAKEIIVETASTGFDPTLSRVGDLEMTQERLEAEVSALVSEQASLRESISEANRSQEMQLGDLKLFFAEKLGEIQARQAAKQRESSEHAQQIADAVDVSMVFVEAKEETNRQHVSEVIPANTIVRCKVVQGARASAGVGESNQMDMVLLRPISNGWLPNGVRVEGFKDTIISAEAIGNATKKLAYVRPHIMTRVFKDGTFLETTIAGHVAGEHGGTGVVCAVINPSWKAPLLVGASAALSEVSKAIGQQSSFLDVLKLGKTESNVNISIDALKRGSFQGASTAWDKLAEYFLKKEELNAPFCILEQGRTVDLIFETQCAWGEKNIKEKLRIKRELEKKALAKEKRHA